MLVLPFLQPMEGSQPAFKNYESVLFVSIYSFISCVYPICKVLFYSQIKQ